jgi:amino acid efflux transporter
MKMRSINLPQACALYIAAILGSGVLFMSGTTAHVAGPASLLAWAVIILLSFPLAYAFAAMSRLHPDAGGAATFVKMAFGTHAGALVGWFYYFAAAVGQMIVSLTGAYYVSTAFHLSKAGTLSVALFIIAAGGAANAYGLRLSGKLSLVLSSLLISLLLTVILLSLPRIAWSHFTPFFPHGMYSIGTAMAMIFWSFFGWEAICSLADRFKRPETDLVRSSMISAVIIGLLFLLLSFVTIGTKTYGSTASNLSPVGMMMYHAWGIGAQAATACLAFLICLSTVNAYVASTGQLGFALSRDGALPHWLSQLHPTRQTPVRSIGVFVITSILGIVACVAYDIPFDSLLFIPNSLGLTVYLLSMAAGLKLFKRRSLPWWASLVSLGLCLVSLPFFGLYVFIPVLLSAAYVLYTIRRKQWVRKKKTDGP